MNIYTQFNIIIVIVQAIWDEKTRGSLGIKKLF